MTTQQDDAELNRLIEQYKARRAATTSAEKPAKPAPAKEAEPKAQRPRAPQIGVITPATIERAFIGMLYLACFALVVLSVVGTFYGLQRIPAPLLSPVLMFADVLNNGGGFGLAVAIQVALTLTQYGARAMARRDRRWWFLYLAALAISVYYNFQAYYVPITAMANAPIAWLLIIAGDVLPEFIAVKRR